MRRAVIALALLAAMLPAIAEQTPEEMRREIEAEFARTKAQDAAAKAAAGKIGPNALSRYTREQYPKTYALWGDDGVARIAAHERRAAGVVAADKRCDMVELVGLSTRSIAPSRIVVYVDCRNQERFLVGPGELANGQARRPTEFLGD